MDIKTRAMEAWKQYALPVFENLKKESDRGSVLVGAAFLDNLLERMLRLHLNSKGDKEKIVDALFNFESVLGSLSSKIKMCYCLDLINKEIYSDCEIIRKIRNMCAHSSDNVFFGTRDVISLSVNLKGWQQSSNKNTDELKELLKLKNISDDVLQYREKLRFILTLCYWTGFLAGVIARLEEKNKH